MTGKELIAINSAYLQSLIKLSKLSDTKKEFDLDYGDKDQFEKVRKSSLSLLVTAMQIMFSIETHHFGTKEKAGLNTMLNMNILLCDYFDLKLEDLSKFSKELLGDDGAKR